MTEATFQGQARVRATTRVMARPSAWLPTLITVGVALLAFGWLTYLLMRRADGLATRAYDQAFFEQVVWNVSQGHGFVSSFSGGSFLGLHFSPLLAIPAIVETVWADARVLSVLHALALAAAGPAAFMFFRAALRPAPSAPWLAAAIAAPIPIWSAIQEAGAADFHTESLALPVALLAGWAGLSGRIWLMFMFAGIVLLAKEDQGFTVFVIGALIASRSPGRLMAGRRLVRGHRLAGFGLMVLGVIWTLVVIGLVMPILRDGAHLDTAWYYGWLMGDGGPLANLGLIGEQISNVDGWRVAAGMLISSAALGLLRPAWLLLTLPPVVANLLSANSAQADLTLHYTLLPLVPVLVAAALGARRFLAWTHRGWRHVLGPRRSSGPALFVLAVPALIVAWAGGGLPPTARTVDEQWDRPAGREQLVRFADQVPDDAILSADFALGAPLATRHHLQLVPPGDAGAWVLIDRLAYTPNSRSRERRNTFVAELPESGRPLLASDGRFELWGPLDG